MTQALPDTAREPSAIDGTAAKPSRMDRKRAQTRERILDVAEQMLTSEGRKARIEDVAEAADVSVGAIYNHFGNKDGLLTALGERALGQLNGYLDDAFDPALSPLEQVMAVADLYLHFCLERRQAFRLLVVDRSSVADPTANTDQNSLSEGTARLLRRFEGAIAAAVDAGEIDSACSPAHTALFLWGAWNGVITLSLRNDNIALSQDELTACLDVGRRIVNEGLTAPTFRHPNGHSRARLFDADQILAPRAEPSIESKSAAT